MQKVNYLLRWSLLLLAALLLPVALPAGGNLESSQSQIRRRKSSNQLFAGKHCILQVSPLTVAPTLRKVPLGTPLRILRVWTNDDGKQWLQVHVSSASNSAIPSKGHKGWLNV